MFKFWFHDVAHVSPSISIILDDLAILLIETEVNQVLSVLLHHTFEVNAVLGRVQETTNRDFRVSQLDKYLFRHRVCYEDFPHLFFGSLTRGVWHLVHKTRWYMLYFEKWLIHTVEVFDKQVSICSCFYSERGYVMRLVGKFLTGRTERAFVRIAQLPLFASVIKIDAFLYYSGTRHSLII